MREICRLGECFRRDHRRTTPLDAIQERAGPDAPLIEHQMLDVLKCSGSDELLVRTRRQRTGNLRSRGRFAVQAASYDLSQPHDISIAAPEIGVIPSPVEQQNDTLARHRFPPRRQVGLQNLNFLPQPPLSVCSKGLLVGAIARRARWVACFASSAAGEIRTQYPLLLYKIIMHVLREMATSYRRG